MRGQWGTSGTGPFDPHCPPCPLWHSFWFYGKIKSRRISVAKCKVRLIDDDKGDWSTISYRRKDLFL